MRFLDELFGARRQESWRRFSEQIGGTYTQGSAFQGGSVQATVRGWPLTLELYSRGAEETRTLCTRLRAPYVDASGFRFSLTGSAARGESVHHADLPAVQIGEPHLSGAFVLCANDPERARALLATAGLLEMLDARPTLALYVAAAGPALHCEVAEFVADVPGLMALTNLVVDTLGQLEALEAAAPPPQRGGKREGSLAPDRVLAGLAPEQPRACFFCGCPLRADWAEVAAITVHGSGLRPLVCHRHAVAVAAGEQPTVRGRGAADAVVPWFQDDAFQPAWDFDPADTEPSLSWSLLPPRLFEPQPRVIVHADDPRWLAPPTAAAAPPTPAAPPGVPGAAPSPATVSFDLAPARAPVAPPLNPAPPAAPPQSLPAAAPAAPLVNTAPPAAPSSPPPAAEALPAPPAVVPPAARPVAAPASVEPGPASPAPEPGRAPLPGVGGSAAHAEWAVTLLAYGPYAQFAALPPIRSPHGQFVVVEVAVTNRGEHTAIFTTGDLALETAAGTPIAPAIQLPGLEKGIWLVQTVQAGATAETRIVFDVESTAQPLTLQILGLRFSLPSS
jgi:hypothetical protein